MQDNGKLLKDILFQDNLFWFLVDSWGPDTVYSEIEEFLGELTFQLKNIEGSDKWRRSVTALVIRGKRRLRELENGEYGI